jgi:hypothetical protein
MMAACPSMRTAIERQGTLAARVQTFAQTVALFLPFRRTKDRQTPAQSEGQKSSDSRSDRARSGNV